jgi:hypothetical protein
VRSGDLSEAVRRGGGREVRVWPTTALSLIDGQTRALNLAARVARQPEELPGAVAELLGAGLITDRLMAPARPARAGIADETVLRIPSPWSGLFAFQRPDSPFTPAERARAVRLAEIAASTTLAQRGPASPVHEDPAIPRSG